MHKHLHTIRTGAQNSLLRYRSLRRRYRYSAWGFLGLAAISILSIGPIRETIFPPSSHARMYFVAPKEVTVDQEFTVEIHVDTQGNAVNAVGTVMHFNPKIFEILNMTTSTSFCSFYTENSFDTIKGNVELSCGTPNPGFNGTSPIALIKMRSKLLGKDSFVLDPVSSTILANDGKGTNILLDPQTIVIQVKQGI